MRLLILFILFPFFLLSQTQIGYDIDGLIAGDQSGYAVSISGDGSIVAIGSPSNESGHVQVFENISGDWERIGYAIHGEATGDNFGSSVSLSSDGSIVAIGSPKSETSDTDAGYIRVFEKYFWDMDTSWC